MMQENREDALPRHIWQFEKGRYKGILRHAWHQTLQVEYWRRIYMTLRFLYYSRVRDGLSTLLGDERAVSANTVSHNLKGLRRDLAVVRSDALIKPLSVIECLDPDAKILCVGPRSEGELFNLAAHGFSLENIRGLDLISYSPLVDLGDMHQMPYTDSSWDAVVAGWIIAYSEEKQRAASEIVRVCKPGGVIAVGVEYNPRSRESIIAELGYIPGSEQYIVCLDELLALFAGHVDHIYFSQEPVESKRNRMGSIVAIFSVKK